MISEDFGRKKASLQFTEQNLVEILNKKEIKKKETTQMQHLKISQLETVILLGDAGSSLPNIETVIEKIKEIKRDNKFIFGGDANIYYGDNDNNQIENNNTIGLLVNTLKKDPDLKDAIKHVLISKVIKKQRRFEPLEMPNLPLNQI